MSKQKHIVILTIQKRMVIDPEEPEALLAEEEARLQSIGWGVREVNAIRQDNEPHISDAEEMELDDE
jgi:hypothetical protein